MTTALKHNKVLVVEDEVDILQVMQRKIAGAGYQVVEAQDGEEALRKIAGESPDVILLDLILPKIDGLQVLKELKARYAPENWIPVIVVTAREDIDTFNEEFFAMADYYIQKPCRMTDIIRAIHLMLKIKFRVNVSGGNGKWKRHT
jgi:DNA-binding response OmpR family regulator